jgi:hypothetical protein
MPEIGLTTESRGKWRSHYLAGPGVSMLVPRSWSITQRDGRSWCERAGEFEGLRPSLSFGEGVPEGPLPASDSIAARARELEALHPGYASVAACELWIDDRRAWWLDHRYDGPDGVRVRARVCEVQQGEAELLTIRCACADAAWAAQDPWFEVVIRSVRFVPRVSPSDGPRAR